MVQHLYYLQKFLALNTDDILIFSLQDVFSGIKTQLLIPILLFFMIKNNFFVEPPLLGGATFILAPKIQRGDPLAKKYFLS